MRKAIGCFVGVAALLLAPACGESDNGEETPGNGVQDTNALTVGGETYDLGTMFVDDYSSVITDPYNIAVYLGPPGATVNDQDGFNQLDHYVFLDFFFSQPEISAGTYEYSESPTVSADTLSQSSCAQANNAWYYLTGGNVTVDVNGSTYTIQGSVDVDDGTGPVTATIHYEGEITHRFE